MDDRSRAADAKVGIFVLSALAVLVAGSLWIAGATFLGAERIDYKVRLPDSDGVSAGDRVRVAGVSVGRVQRVSLRPGDELPVVLHVSLRPEVDVRANATAWIATLGLLGSSFLQIDPGSPGAASLAAGGDIRGQSSLGLEQALAQVEDLSGKMVEVLDKTASILDQVSAELGPMMARIERLLSEDNASDVRAILTGLRTTLDEGGPRLARTLARLDSISSQLEQGVTGFPELTAKLSTLVDDVQAVLGPEGSRLSKTLDAAQGSLDSADEALSLLADNRGEIEATVHDLRDTVANLKSFSRQIKERPSSLVRIKAEPDRRPGQGVR